MNAIRRKRLAAVKDGLQQLRDELTEIIEEEQEAYDAMPESIQMSYKGDAATDLISSLEQVMEQIDECSETLACCLED